MYRASLGVLEIYGGQESYIFFSGRARRPGLRPAPGLTPGRIYITPPAPPLSAAGGLYILSGASMPARLRPVRSTCRTAAVSINLAAVWAGSPSRILCSK